MIVERIDEIVERQEVLELKRVSHRRKSASQSSRQVQPRRSSTSSSSSSSHDSSKDDYDRSHASSHCYKSKYYSLINKQ